MCAAARARSRALSLSLFTPKHLPHLCGTQTGVHGRVPQRHLLQRHLPSSKRRQSPGVSCARRSRARAQERGTEHRGNGRCQSRSARGGARRRCRSGDHHLSPPRLRRGSRSARAGLARLQHRRLLQSCQRPRAQLPAETRKRRMTQFPPIL
jgi:hypothetical protein